MSEFYQQVLPFDFWEEERQRVVEAREKAISGLKRYDNPKNDNESLFNLQYNYYHNDKSSLSKMYFILIKVGCKLAQNETKARRLKVTSERIKEIALEASELVIEQYLKNELMIKDSFLSYLYLQILKVLYYRNGSQLIEDYCRKHKIDFFTLSEEEKQEIKVEVERKNIQPGGTYPVGSFN